MSDMPDWFTPDSVEFDPAQPRPALPPRGEGLPWPALPPRGEGLPWPVTDRVGAPEVRPSLGARVTVTKIMRRASAMNTRNTYWPTWVSVDLQKPLQGVYIGYRTKQSGYMQYDEGTSFVQTGTVSVALVVVDPRKKPITVAWEGMG